MVLGAWLGTMAFRRVDPRRFRRWVVLVLAGLSIVSLMKALLAMIA